jgi:hypothetical protein
MRSALMSPSGRVVLHGLRGQHYEYISETFSRAVLLLSVPRCSKRSWSLCSRS